MMMTRLFVSFIGKNLLFIIGFFAITNLINAQITPAEVLERVDANLSANTRVFVSEMTIHGKRFSQTLQSKTYSAGNSKAFTEYLSPAREAGTKLLMLDDKLWIYTPSSDRTIQLSGHMLKQSVMGSDLSYEDLMSDTKLTEEYEVVSMLSEIYQDRKSYLMELVARTESQSYARRKMWIDAEYFVPLKEELYAKSGQLLKQASMSDLKQIQGRWFPTQMVYRDMLKNGKGTEFRILSMEFNQAIPEHLFSKAVLR